MRAFCGFVPRAMGTKLDFVTLGTGSGPAQELWDSVLVELRTLESILDRFNPSGEVFRLDASLSAATFRKSRELEKVISLCEDYRIRTGGLFDVRAGGKYDFGGFAKGYFLKKCLEMLRKAGVGDAFVNFGNSTILGLGKNPAGEPWSVDLMDPYSGNPVKRIVLEDAALSTSGNTPGYSGHTIDPRTGLGVSDHRLAVALGSDPLDSEVLSTAAMAGGPGSLPVLREAFPFTRIEIHTL